MTGVDRLTGSDVIAFTMQRLGWPQDIGAVALLDPAPLLDRDGTLRIEAVRSAVAARLARVPRFRQVVHRPPPGLGRPLWLDARSVDLSYHVTQWRLEPGASEETLLEVVDALRRQPLDPARPLWRIWLIPGLRGGRVAMYLRVHHALADGVAGVALLGQLLSATPNPNQGPDAEPAGSPPAPPRSRPTTGVLLRDQLNRAATGTVRALSTLVHVSATARRLHRLGPALREIFAVEPAPRTSLNAPLGPERHVFFVRERLDSTRDAARSAGATVNDVVLAAIAGGLREVLRGRGERVEGLELRVAVPVSLHRGPSTTARGNAVAPMAVPLPLGDPDPHRRVRRIAADTAVRRSRPRPQLFSSILAAPIVQRVSLFWWRRQRIVNVYIGNVVGPPTALYLAGARLLELFPIVPLTGNVTLGVGVLSYDGQLNLTVVMDRRGWPDRVVFRRALNASLAALVAPPTTALVQDDSSASRVTKP